jgi:hypothetical protein
MEREKMTTEKLTELRRLCEKHGQIPHNFICQDPTQQIQVDYWNATNPAAILGLIDMFEKAKVVIKDVIYDLDVSLEDGIHKPLTVQPVIEARKRSREFLTSLEGGK